MEHFVLTDSLWAQMEPLCLGKVGDPGRTGTDNRLFVEGVLWVARTGGPWKDIPAVFGKKNTVYVRYRYWMKNGIFKRMFAAVANHPDMNYTIAFNTVVMKGQLIQRARRGPKPKPRAYELLEREQREREQLERQNQTKPKGG